MARRMHRIVPLRVVFGSFASPGEGQLGAGCKRSEPAPNWCAPGVRSTAHVPGRVVPGVAGS